MLVFSSWLAKSTISYEKNNINQDLRKWSNYKDIEI